jgi:hypothetical protein
MENPMTEGELGDGVKGLVPVITVIVLAWVARFWGRR